MRFIPNAGAARATLAPTRPSPDQTQRLACEFFAESRLPAAFANVAIDGRDLLCEREE